MTDAALGIAALPVLQVAEFSTAQRFGYAAAALAAGLGSFIKVLKYMSNNRARIPQPGVPAACIGGHRPAPPATARRLIPSLINHA